MSSFVLLARVLLAPLFVYCLSLAVAIPPDPCEMQVKDGPHTLLWHCKPSNGKPCANCDVTGVCQSYAVEVGGAVLHWCVCNGTTASSFDDCYTTVKFDQGTGTITILCENECCIELLVPRCKNPAPGAAYPKWADPCPCS
jgi:hypothetical protein